MKITLYTVSDCQFSKQEKDYLTAHALLFEEKNLETNRDFLTEMLTLSNNFAGTPVTKIEKDDGQIVVLKGFTQEEFDKTLGIVTTQPAQPQVAQAPAQMQAPAQNPPPTQPAVQATPASPPPEPQTPQAPQPAPTMSPPPPPAPVQMPEPPVPPQPAQPNPMNTVLNNLQEQSTATPPLPNIPDPKL